MFNRKSLVAPILIPLLAGIGGLVRVMDRSTIRVVDVVQLTGSGMCFGVTLMSLFLLLRSPRE